MQNYEVDSDAVTSSKINFALERSMTVKQGKAVEVKAAPKSEGNTPATISSNTKPEGLQKRRASLFPGELM